MAGRRTSSPTPDSTVPGSPPRCSVPCRRPRSKGGRPERLIGVPPCSGDREAAEQNRAVVSFGDSDIIRSAIRVEGFRDEEFDYQLIKAVGVADYGGSTVGECLAVANEITDGSPQSWARGFDELAHRVEAKARDCLEAGHRVSGRDHLLRASTYFRTAEYYVDPATEVSRHTGERSRACFVEAGSLMVPPVELVDVPFDGSRLSGYFLRPSATG